MERICIVSPNYKAYSETFIQNHIDRLPGKKTVIYSLGNDAYDHNGNTLLKMDRVSRFIRFLERVITKTDIVKQEVAALLKLIRKQKIKYVLAEYGTTGAIFAKACKENQISLVVHFHGYDAYEKNLLLKHRDLYHEMFAYAKAIIVVSNDMQEQLYKIGAPYEKVKYIPYGIDLVKFKPIIQKQGSVVFLAIGRFVEKKAPYLTILAFSKVVRNVPNAKLILAGTGPLLPVCKQLVKSLKLVNDVEFKGAISQNMVCELMHDSFCFVQHSITTENGDSEGTPLSVLEASACGLPVISTKHAGIKNAILHGKSGYLVEEGDVDEMAHYMLSLLQQPELAKQFGKQGRRWVKTHYNLDNRINDLWEVLIS